MNNAINLAIKAAIEAGREILNIYNSPDEDFSIELKKDNSPLTKADKASHEIIIAILSETGFPVLSEEGKNIAYNERKKWSTFWLIDPLDGTKEFIKRNGEFTVNIALINNGSPVLGVIYIPVIKTIYLGGLNVGAWKKENVKINTVFDEMKKEGAKLPLQLKKRRYTIVGSRSHMNDETKNYINELRREHPGLDMVTSGSSVKICMVAEGLADEYPRFGPTMEWDTAAGHAIANAAGKKIWLTDFSNELSYNKDNLLNPFFIVK